MNGSLRRLDGLAFPLRAADTLAVVLHGGVAALFDGIYGGLARVAGGAAAGSAL